jgi:hypothetical protein
MMESGQGGVARQKASTSDVLAFIVFLHKQRANKPESSLLVRHLPAILAFCRHTGRQYPTP